MKTRQLNRLSAKAVAAKTKSGLYCDGGGLYLQVSASGSKAWIFRYRSPITKKLRDMGLGSLLSVGLADARGKAAAQHNIVACGLDPIAMRDAECLETATRAAKSMTFSACAAAYIESHRSGWRTKSTATNEKARSELIASRSWVRCQFKKSIQEWS